MNTISLPKASALTSPNPLVLVCTRREDGGTNLATVSWWNYLSFNPGMVAFAMAKTSYSGQRVRDTGKVVLTVPGKELAQLAIQCGSSTGHKTDKVKEFNVEMEDIETGGIQVPAHSKVAIEATLKEFVETGDHYLYICSVENVYANEGEEALFAWNGYSKIAPATIGS